MDLFNGGCIYADAQGIAFMGGGQAPDPNKKGMISDMDLIFVPVIQLSNTS